MAIVSRAERLEASERENADLNRRVNPLELFDPGGGSAVV
jgi:hypothetical protein